MWSPWYHIRLWGRSQWSETEVPSRERIEWIWILIYSKYVWKKSVWNVCKNIDNNYISKIFLIKIQNKKMYLVEMFISLCILPVHFVFLLLLICFSSSILSVNQTFMSLYKYFWTIEIPIQTRDLKMKIIRMKIQFFFMSM